MGSAAAKTRIYWVPIVVLISIAAGYFGYQRWIAPAIKPPAASARSAQDRAITPPPPAIPPVAVQPPVIATQPLALPPPPRRVAPELFLPIQNQATIDFSIGSPVIKRGGSDEEAMQRALKEMEEATKNLAIPPAKKDSAPR